MSLTCMHTIEDAPLHSDPVNLVDYCPGCASVTIEQISLARSASKALETMRGGQVFLLGSGLGLFERGYRSEYMQQLVSAEYQLRISGQQSVSERQYQYQAMREHTRRIRDLLDSAIYAGGSRVKQHDGSARRHVGCGLIVSMGSYAASVLDPGVRWWQCSCSARSVSRHEIYVGYPLPPAPRHPKTTEELREQDRWHRLQHGVVDRLRVIRESLSGHPYLDQSQWPVSLTWCLYVVSAYCDGASSGEPYWQYMQVYMDLWMEAHS